MDKTSNPIKQSRETRYNSRARPANDTPRHSLRSGEPGEAVVLPSASPVPITVLKGHERKQYLRAMTYEMIEFYKKQNGGQKPPKIWLNNMMFILSKKLLEESGIDVGLPYYWYLDGVEVEWQEIESGHPL